MALPPSLLGALHDTLTCVSPTTPITSRGAVGSVAVLTVAPLPKSIAASAAMSPLLPPTLVMLLEPRRPLSPLPQHLSDALSSTAHVCSAPALIASAVRPDPRLMAGKLVPISDGVSPSEFWLPLPNLPKPPSPKHFTSVEVRTTHVWACPADTAIAVSLVLRLTAASDVPISPGPSPTLLVAPLPNRPFPPPPQHTSAPLSKMAHT